MKRLYIRGIIGFPLGICSAYLLSLLYSYYVGSTIHLSTLPIFNKFFSTPLYALTFQTLFAGFTGMFAVSLITLFETPAWSNAKAILLHTISTVLLQISLSLILWFLPQSPPLFYFLIVSICILAFLFYRILLRNTKHHVAYLNMQLEKIEQRGKPYDK